MNHKLHDEYTDLAPAYDERWSDYLAKSLEMTLSAAEYALGQRAPQRVLDVACGTGLLLSHVESRFRTCRNVGIDLVPAMLAQARQRPLARSTFAAGEAAALPLPDASFDLVLSTSALHYFDDVPGALADMRRVITADGTLVITDWCREYLTIKCLDAVLPWTPEAHVKAFTRPELSAALRKAGFRVVDAEAKRIDWLWGLMTVTAVPR
jgi:ubiquinone/menaquinone biosynthesis C-methylase UbiE